MLAKQGWRIIHQPHSLIARILKGRYFPRSDFFNAKLGHNPSYTWRSIVQGADVLRKGVRWRVGDGKNIKVWKDPWLPNESGFQVGVNEDQIVSDLRVADLMTTSGDRWDLDKVRASFSTEDAERVISLPIFPLRGDRLIWHFEKKGMYSVRSGYHVANVSAPLPGIEWSKVWGAKVPPKVKVFLWRALRNILPTREMLSRRGVLLDTTCGCGHDIETVDHALLGCPSAVSVWNLWTRGGRVIQDNVTASFVQLCEQSNCQAVAEFSMIVWAIWWARNQRVWEGVGVSSGIILRKALDSLRDWSKVHENNEGVLVVSHPACCVPNTGREEWVGEIDAAIYQNPRGMGIGMIIRKGDGSFHKAYTSHNQGLFAPRMAESLALKEGLKVIESLMSGAGKLCMDAQGVVQSVVGEGEDWSEYGEIIASCREIVQRRGDITVAWISRSNNRVAHELARKAFLFEPCKLWSEVPTCIASLELV